MDAVVHGHFLCDQWLSPVYPGPDRRQVDVGFAYCGLRNRPSSGAGEVDSLPLRRLHFAGEFGELVLHPGYRRLGNSPGDRADHLRRHSVAVPRDTAVGACG